MPHYHQPLRLLLGKPLYLEICVCLSGALMPWILAPPQSWVIYHRIATHVTSWSSWFSSSWIKRPIRFWMRRLDLLTCAFTISFFLLERKLLLITLLRSISCAELKCVCLRCLPAKRLALIQRYALKDFLFNLCLNVLSKTSSCALRFLLNKRDCSSHSILNKCYCFNCVACLLLLAQVSIFVLWCVTWFDPLIIRPYYNL